MCDNSQTAMTTDALLEHVSEIARPATGRYDRIRYAGQPAPAGCLGADATARHASVEHPVELV